MNPRDAYAKLKSEIMKFNLICAVKTPETDILTPMRELLEVYRETELALTPNQ